MYGMYPDWGPAKNRPAENHEAEATMTATMAAPAPRRTRTVSDLVTVAAPAVTAVRDMADWRPDDN